MRCPTPPAEDCARRRRPARTVRTPMTPRSPPDNRPGPVRHLTHNLAAHHHIDSNIQTPGTTPKEKDNTDLIICTDPTTDPIDEPLTDPVDEPLTALRACTGSPRCTAETFPPHSARRARTSGVTPPVTEPCARPAPSPGASGPSFPTVRSDTPRAPTTARTRPVPSPPRAEGLRVFRTGSLTV